MTIIVRKTPQIAKKRASKQRGDFFLKKLKRDPVGLNINSIVLMIHVNVIGLKYLPGLVPKLQPSSMVERAPSVDRRDWLYWGVGYPNPPGTAEIGEICRNLTKFDEI